MKCKANGIRLQFTEQGWPEIVITPTERVEIVDLKAIIARGKELAVEIKQYRKNRSLDANSLCWVLCQKIAEKIQSTKEEVYQTFIKRVGQFEILPIRDDAVDKWIANWSSRGLGWYAEVLDDSKLPGYKKVINFYGSSRYNTREMSVLLDEIVTQCRELGIDTVPPEELQSLKDQWDR